MLLEESISPLRAQIEDLNEGIIAMHERMDAMEAAQAGFVAAQRVQTEALDDALPRLDRVERLAAAELPEQLRDLEERLEGLAAAELPEKLRELEERLAEQAEQASSALALEVVGITRQITATSETTARRVEETLVASEQDWRKDLGDLSGEVASAATALDSRLERLAASCDETAESIQQQLAALEQAARSDVEGCAATLQSALDEAVGDAMRRGDEALAAEAMASLRAREEVVATLSGVDRRVVDQGAELAVSHARHIRPSFRCCLRRLSGLASSQLVQMFGACRRVATTNSVFAHLGFLVAGDPQLA